MAAQIGLQIGAASGCASNLDDDFAWAGARNGKVLESEPARLAENDAAHEPLIIAQASGRLLSMPVIEVKRTIAAPMDKVIEIARDVERYPEFMPDVKSVKVLEQSDDGKRQKVEWVGVIKQFSREIRWIQEDTWDEANNRVDFVQVEGDYDKMQGYWQFTPNGDKTEFVNYLDYEYNVPLLGPLLTKVIDFLVRQNLNSIMDSIEKRAQSQEAIS